LTIWIRSSYFILCLLRISILSRRTIFILCLNDFDLFCGRNSGCFRILRTKQLVHQSLFSWISLLLHCLLLLRCILVVLNWLLLHLLLLLLHLLLLLLLLLKNLSSHILNAHIILVIQLFKFHRRVIFDWMVVFTLVKKVDSRSLRSYSVRWACIISLQWNSSLIRFMLSAQRRRIYFIAYLVTHSLHRYPFFHNSSSFELVS